MSYLALKHLHVTFAALSGMLFFLRGIWALSGSALPQKRWARIVPHLVDTLLLVSAFALVFWSGQYPFVQAWLTAKFIALLAYIGLGIVALKRGQSRKIRIAAFVGALAAFGYILMVAVTKQP